MIDFAKKKTRKVRKPLVANRCVFSCFETFIRFN